MGIAPANLQAITKEGLRNQGITNVYGRRASIDIAGYEVGEQDTRTPIDVVSTTAPTSLAPNGFSLLACTAASSAIYTMNTAVGSVYKQITQVSSSTLGYVVQFGANALIVTSAGSSFNQITFQGVGHTANLACVVPSSGQGSSANTGPVWISCSPASPGLAFSTF
jgi:hypothetical protein